MIRELSILSLNVNGLRGPVRRSQIFSWLKLSHAHIILLQDTRWTPADNNLWSSQWGLPSLWSEHNAILSTNPTLSLSLITPNNIPRTLFAYISYPHWASPITCGSVYIPASIAERASFLQSLPPSLPTEISLLGGDFNISANPALDHAPPLTSATSTSPPSHWRDLADTLLQWGLSDLLRLQSLSTIQCTHWQHCTASYVGTRIDYLCVPPSQSPSFSPLQALHCPYSDHYYLTSTWTLSSSLPHGPGTWKLNTSLLGLPDFQTAIRETWEKSQAEPSPSPQEAWEHAKSAFQATARFLSQSHHRQSLSQFKSLQDQIQNLDTLLSKASPEVLPSLLAARTSTKERLEHQATRTFQGLRVRSRTKWFEQGEKSSSYFHKLIAGRRMSSRLRGLRNSSGIVVSSMEEITGICSDFYSHLYSATPTVPESVNTLLHSSLPSIPAHSSNSLESDITPEEVSQAILSSVNNSTPGTDGLPFEFYKTFSHILASPLASIFNQSLQDGSLPFSFSRSLLTLIFKKKGEESDLKNWRPIALLNCDRKILSKIIATQIQKVAHSIIHLSQTGFIKGRRIQDNTMALYQILDFYRHSPSPGSLIFLDQEKAYDKVNWEYLLACLSRFGFGPKIRTAIQALHSGLLTSITANGFMGIPFTTAQGLPQGDPLSPILYDMVLEPLLAFFRRSLSGLPIPNFPFRVGAFADDMVVGLTSTQDHCMLLEGIALHQGACNASLNLDKSETLLLSPDSNIPPLGKLLSRDSLFTHLGIPFHPQSLPFPSDFYSSLLDKLRATMASWQPRRLSLQGKVLILNSRLLSKL